MPRDLARFALSQRRRRLHCLRRDERGITTSEFLVLLVCIAVAAVGVVRYFGGVILDIIGMPS